MDAVTYPNEEVVDYISGHFVPMQLNIKEDPGAMDRFEAVWTPTIILRDDGGREYRRSEGFLPPKTLLTELALGRTQAALHNAEYDEAVKHGEEAARFAEGDPERLAEARYWTGVAAYKGSNESGDLVKHWKPLVDEMPESAWAKKASFIKDS